MLAFEPPPASVIPETLPGWPCERVRPSWWSEDFTLSNHIIPAAYWRTSGTVKLPTPPLDPSLSKQERVKIATESEALLREFRIREDTKTLTYGPEPQPKLLWICLNRYVRKNIKHTPRGLTLVCSHANGLHKETWEPTLSHLLSSTAAEHIDEVWTWDSIHHGDSGILNAGNLDFLFHWDNNARDLLNFLVYYLPTNVATEQLPLHLQQVETFESGERLKRGFRGSSGQRTVVAVGHSIGGCTSLLAAHAHPSLFSSLVLVDPVIRRPPWDPPMTPEKGRATISMVPRNPLALGALTRRSTWKTREEARRGFSSPFFKAWDPAVLEQYISNAIYEDKEKGVFKLKMDPTHEALLFVETYTGGEPAWLLVPTLDEDVEIRWIMPGEDKDGLGAPGEDRLRVWLRPKNSSHTRIPGAGHLITQEKPQALANEILAFISKKYMAQKIAKL